MRIYRIGDGQYIIARWDERQAQYIGHAIPIPFKGYFYSYAPSLEALAAIGVLTYPTEYAAAAALELEG